MYSQLPVYGLLPLTVNYELSTVNHEPLIMNYQTALDYIYSFINFDRSGTPVNAPNAYNLGRIRQMLELIGEPHLAYPTLVIAGTKGKGSTSALCAAALQAEGYRVGLYTQPHLHTYRERMRVDGQTIAPEEVARLTEYLVPVIDQLISQQEIIGRITMYEISTALALKYFAEQKVDIAVLEIGLGGRLDAVNVVEPLVSVITSISLDHMAILGNTIDKIAYEKAGIIKPNGKVISTNQVPAAMQVIEQVCQERNAALKVVGRDIQYQEIPFTAPLSKANRRRTSHKIIITPPGIKIEIPLLGRHQSQNAALAVTALLEQAQQPRGLKISPLAISEGFKQVRWNARLEVLQEIPLVVADGAHNADSAGRLREALHENFYFEKLILVVGSYRDKDVEGIFEELTRSPKPTQLVLTKSLNPRATPPQELIERAKTFIGEIPCTICDNVDIAMQTALGLAGEADLICTTGSLSIAAEAREYFGLADEGKD
jgi:dihydrofolate synthase / folylpolyglutamate synthase